MSKEWHLFPTIEQGFKRSFGIQLGQKLASGEPRVVERQLAFFESLDLVFDPTLIVSDEIYARIQHDQSLMLEAHGRMKTVTDEMVNALANVIKDGSRHRPRSRERERHVASVAAQVDEVLFGAEVVALEIAEQLLASKKNEWLEAKEFRSQRKFKTSLAVLRMAGGVAGGVLGTLSAVASGGAAIGGAALAWYGCVRAVAAAVQEINQSRMGMYELMAKVDRELARGIRDGVGASIGSGAMRGFLGFSKVNTLQKVLSLIEQVKLKLPHFMENEVDLARKINKLLDEQEKLQTQVNIANQEVLANKARVNAIDGIVNPNFSLITERDDLIDATTHLEEVIATIEKQMRDSERPIHIMLTDHAGGNVSFIDPGDDDDNNNFVEAGGRGGCARVRIGPQSDQPRGSFGIKQWLKRRGELVRVNSRKGQVLGCVEGGVSNVINFGLNTAPSLGMFSWTGTGAQAPTCVDITGLFVTYVGDLESLEQWAKSVIEARVNR